jgi:hypothetical protein
MLESKAKVLDSLARNYLQDGNSEKALDYAMQAQSLWTKKPQEIDHSRSDLTESKLQIAQIYRIMSQEANKTEDEEVIYLDKAKDILTDLQEEVDGRILLKDDMELLHRIELELSRVCCDQKMYEDATAWAEKSHQGRCELFGGYDIGTLQVERHLLYVLLKCGSEDQAAWQKASELSDGFIQKLAQRYGPNSSRVEDFKQQWNEARDMR